MVILGIKCGILEQCIIPWHLLGLIKDLMGQICEESIGFILMTFLLSNVGTRNVHN